MVDDAYKIIVVLMTRRRYLLPIPCVLLLAGALLLSTSDLSQYLIIPIVYREEKSANADSMNRTSSSNGVAGGASNLLLSVPYYVYEDLVWKNATFGDYTMEKLSTNPRRRKHFDDYLFMKASLVHPMRTLDPSLAKLFVIPTLLNSYVSRAYFADPKYMMCYQGLCDKALVETIIPTLRDSKWFQQYPERHIVVQSHYHSTHYGRNNVPDELKELLFKVNAITFEDQVPNQMDRLRLPSTYVGYPCEVEHHKTHDLALTATIKQLSTFKDRVKICQWLDNSTWPNTPPGHRAIRMSHCGPGTQCPSLAQAKYGFHTRGDTFGSQRPMDTIMSGTVPIFTRREQYNILPSWLDWRKLSVLLPMNDIKNRAQFMKKLQAILRDTKGYNDRYQAVLQHQDILDWYTLHPFDIYMYSLQAELYPETRHKTDILEHVFPALNLPPPVS